MAYHSQVVPRGATRLALFGEDGDCEAEPHEDEKALEDMGDNLAFLYI